jgi:hypothetical protein
VGACRDVGRTADSTLGTAGLYFTTVPDPAVGQKRRRVATDLTDRDVVTAPVGGAIHS